jgi:hypothetical protein
MIVFDGALVQSLVQRSTRPARDARGLADALIDASLGETRRSRTA